MMTPENQTNKTMEESIQAVGATEPSAHSEVDTGEASAERLQRYRTLASKNKKRIIIICAAVLVGIALLFGAVTLIEHLSNRPPEIPEYNFHFYQPYRGDIMNYAPYLALDRQVYYCEDPSGDGLRTAVNEENLSEYDSKVLFLYLYFQTIIAGNTEAYNGYFNANYYKNAQPLEPFHPQMLYDMEIIYQGGEEAGAGEKLISYRISYRIHRNDGSFRRDIDSDASRDQTITLRVNAEGDITIERLVTHYTVVK